MEIENQRADEERQRVKGGKDETNILTSQREKDIERDEVGFESGMKWIN